MIDRMKDGPMIGRTIWERSDDWRTHKGPMMIMKKLSVVVRSS